MRLLLEVVLPCRVVDLEEVAHLGQPAILYEANMSWMTVVALVCGSVCELHRDPEPVVILRADLGQQLEPLDARNSRESLGGLEEVALAVGCSSARTGAGPARAGGGGL
jgi:hypothetical protein